jgi:hypothetical protein
MVSHRKRLEYAPWRSTSSTPEFRSSESTPTIYLGPNPHLQASSPPNRPIRSDPQLRLSTIQESHIKDIETCSNQSRKQKQVSHRRLPRTYADSEAGDTETAEAGNQAREVPLTVDTSLETNIDGPATPTDTGRLSTTVVINGLCSSRKTNPKASSRVTTSLISA